MRKILIKIIAVAILLGAGFVGFSSEHKASASTITPTTTVTTSTFDPGGGVRP